MFLGSTFRYLSYIYILKLIIDKAFSGKVRFRSVYIEKAFLSTLIADEKFKSILFSSDYDGRPIIKDRVILLGYLQEDNGALMKKLPLKVLNEGKVFDNEKNYSRYELTKADLAKIIGRYGEDAQYFIFSPITYRLDEEYLAYEVIPADQHKVPLKKRQQENAAQEQSINSTTEDAGAPSLRTGEVTMALRASFQYEVTGVMNPSPPATSTFEFAW
jgi:hypothetical protein